MTEADPIPLSALQHWAYCPRQCGLIHLEQAFADNIHTARGQAVHHLVDTPGYEIKSGVRVERALPLWSDRLTSSARPIWSSSIRMATSTRSNTRNPTPLHPHRMTREPVSLAVTLHIREPALPIAVGSRKLPLHRESNKVLRLRCIARPHGRARIADGHTRIRSGCRSHGIQLRTRQSQNRSKGCGPVSAGG